MSQKQRRAVLVSISEQEGKVLLRLDDVKQGSAGSKVWEQDVHYTHKTITLDQFKKLEFDDKELADFGLTIIARLYAFMKRGEL